MVGIFIVIWLCWLVFHNEAHLHMHLWCPWGRWLARIPHCRGNHVVLGQFPKWHNSQLFMDHRDFGLTQSPCQSKNWHTIWFKGRRINYISCINAMNPCAASNSKVTGPWSTISSWLVALIALIWRIWSQDHLYQNTSKKSSWPWTVHQLSIFHGRRCLIV